eukprot:TRINITY_DN771_c0_g2_i2.p1 TRINITY_DN771_c0_g2~~TRINITY_DN771_c0_g2_i2.p1  ORF type:complete len:361 (-),score=68.10 TRINITY_DN771_c0_g2_i2:163-1245(-)
MGMCGSNAKGNEADDDDEEESRSEGSRDDDQEEKEIKLLLLGAGDSGKSTIAKQMQIIYLTGFSNDERKGYKELIYSNIAISTIALLDAGQRLGVALKDSQNEKRAASLRQVLSVAEGSVQNLTPEVGNDIKALWQDDGIQTLWKRNNEFQIQDNTPYYFGQLDRITKPGYIPSEEDVLRSRAKTTGITNTRFQIDGMKFNLVDVGGQRSERKKWIHCFENVTMVIFCVAMSEYDMKLYEDDRTNRMAESLKLFEEITNSKWFAETPIVLFLNKSDMFRVKLEEKKTDLKVCFPEYSGGCNFDLAADFIKSKFVSLNRNPQSKPIYAHITCATDTSNIRVIFKAVKDTILASDFKNAGLK